MSDTPQVPADETSTQARISTGLLQVTEQDIDRLRTLLPVVVRHTDAVIDEFYRTLRAFPSARKLLGDEERTARIMEEQKRYIGDVFGGAYDGDYEQRRIQIGQRHYEVGVEPEWYLGAYHLYQRLLFPLIEQHLSLVGASRQEILDHLLSVTKVMSHLPLAVPSNAMPWQA